MGAAIGTIPYFSTYQPGALPIASTVYLEIVDSLSATSAQSFNMSQQDLVGKAPAIIPNANPVASDRFAFFQVATGLPKACTLGNFGVPFGNVPTGGSTGQMLVKLSATNFDASWSSIIQGPFGVVGTASITGTLLINGVAPRERLNASRTYFVRTTGSDSNNGLTSGTAFATVQKAIDIIDQTIDQGGQTLTVDIGAGNWDGSGSPFIFTPPVGAAGSNLTVRGAGSGLTSISLWFRIDGGFTVSQLAIDAALGDSFAGLYSGEHAEVVLDSDVLFKTTSLAGFTDIYCYDSAAVTLNADITVSGNKNTFYYGSGFARLASIGAHNIVCVGTPVFSSEFLSLSENMVVEWGAVTSSGGATGKRFKVTGSNVTLLMNDLTQIPGNAVGTYTADPVDVGALITELAAATTFVLGGTTSVSGRFGVTGTAAFTGVFGIVGTTLVTGTLGAVGTAAFTGVHGIVGTTLVTGAFGVVGTSLVTGILGVVGTATITGSLIVNSSTATIVGVDAGTTGPVWGIYHSSPSPAALDQVGRVRFFGNNSAAAKTEYGEIGAQILSTTAGQEYGCIVGQVISTGALTDVGLADRTFMLGYQNPASDNFEYVFRCPTGKKGYMYLESFDGGALGPGYNLWHNSPTQAANDIPGYLAIDGNADNGTTYIHYSEIDTIITNANTTGGGARMVFKTISSAVMSETMSIDDHTNLVIGTGTIASAAANGFLYLPATNGTPTGTPTSYAGHSPVVIDSTNNRIYFYSSGAWRNAGP